MRRYMFGLLVGAITFVLGVGSVILYISRNAAPIMDKQTAAQPARQDRVVLEVTSRDTISACYTDEYTELRVYESGLAEADVFTPGSTCMPSKRSSHLGTEELAELVTLLKRPALTSVNSEYPQFAIYTDSVTYQTITFAREAGQKKIALINPSPTNPKNKANYPPELIDLLLRVQDLRARLGQVDG